MEITPTSKSTHRLTWPDGYLDLNLIPMNVDAACGTRVGYASVRADGILSNSIADLVGIVGLKMNNCPSVPRICWDNREHHFWDGFEGAFEPRNVVVNAPTVEKTGSHSIKAGFFYIANLVKTTVNWVIRESEFLGAKPVWNTSITIENLSGHTLRNYLHFFACYHTSGQNYYWSSDGDIKPCASGGFSAVADSDQEIRLRSSPYHKHGERYRGAHEIQYFRHCRPVLLSQCQPWYGGARHVILVEPEKCAAIVTWMNQARDYMIRPPNYDLKPGEIFTARIRHAIVSVKDEADIENLWSLFMKDLTTA